MPLYEQLTIVIEIDYGKEIIIVRSENYLSLILIKMLDVISPIKLTFAKNFKLLSDFFKAE